MTELSSCYYTECYSNHNLDHVCLIEQLTVSATGMCENLTHCDEFQCSECERFSVCTKPKKQESLDE